MVLSTHEAVELGEALIDASKMASEVVAPVGVIPFRNYLLATRLFDEAEAVVIVVPSQTDDESKVVPLRGVF